jgi:hypothetical protein
MGIHHVLTPQIPLDGFADNPVCLGLPGAIPIEKIWIDFSNIKSDAELNPFRAGYTNLTNQNLLRISLSNGIHDNEPLPVVEKLKNPYVDKKTGRTVDYVIRDGFTRFNALRELGYTGYGFQVISFDSDNTRAKFSARSNQHTPRSSSTEKDMQHMMVDLVARGLVADDYDEMKQWLMENCGVKVEKAKKVINMVANDKGDGIVVYTAPQVKDLANDLNIAINGKYDPTRGKNGYAIRSIYEGRTILKMIRQLRLTAEQGHPILSYATITTKELPTPGKNIDDQRDLSVSVLKSINNDLKHFAKWQNKNPNKDFFEILGYLPQTKDERKEKKILPLRKAKTKKESLDKFFEQFSEDFFHDK